MALVTEVLDSCAEWSLLRSWTSGEFEKFSVFSNPFPNVNLMCKDYRHAKELFAILSGAHPDPIGVHPVILET